MVAVRERWSDLVPDGGPLADQLVERYTGPDRRAYRDQYLDTVLATLETLVQLSTDPTSVRLAAWFHRAVHEPGGTAAEDAEASARLAEQTLPAYGVDPVRVAEVARLVRRTGRVAPAAIAPPRTPPVAASGDAAPDRGPGTEPGRPDANADVLLDAINSVLATTPTAYTVHAAEVRNDRTDLPAGLDGTGRVDQTRVVKHRYEEVREFLAGPIFRTRLARERLAGAARANLEKELARLDRDLPARWRGWHLAALAATATFGAIAAAVVAIAAAEAPWRVPVLESEPAWPPVLLAVLAFAGAPVLFHSARLGDRRAQLVGAAVAGAAAAGLVVAWARVPVTNPASGVGFRVPLLMSSLLLLLLAGGAALAASVLRARTSRFVPARNVGQQLSWFAVPVAIAVTLLLVVQPVARTYVFTSNEQLRGDHPPVGQMPRSGLDGTVAWISRSPAGVGTDEAVSTNFGIAIPRRTGVVEMLDPQTGEVRWRYSRTDSEETPDLYVTGGGRLLVVEFSDLGYLLLDADTGRRKAVWPRGTRDHVIQQADPLLTVEDGSGPEKLRGVGVDGRDRWTFEPGRCIDVTAVATADTAVALLDRDCGPEPNELAGLDVESGKKLWSVNGQLYARPTVVGDVVVVAEHGAGTRRPGALVAIEPRTGERRWRWAVPAEWSCRTAVTASGNLLIVVDCPGRQGRAGGRGIVTALDVATGAVAWQQTGPVGADAAPVVTADARVVSLDYTVDGCWANVIGESGHRRVRLPAGVACRSYLRAVGNLVLTAGDGSIIALG